MTLDGVPLAPPHGLVIFEPDRSRGNTGLRATGAIDARGRYALYTWAGSFRGYGDLVASKRGAAPGWYKVAVVAREAFDPGRHAPQRQPAWLIPERYGDPNTSGLVAEVAEGRGYDLRLSRSGVGPTGH